MLARSHAFSVTKTDHPLGKPRGILAGFGKNKFNEKLMAGDIEDYRNLK